MRFFMSVCVSVCLSVCPVHDLTFESLDLELGAPAVPGTKTVPSGMPGTQTAGGLTIAV